MVKVERRIGRALPGSDLATDNRSLSSFPVINSCSCRMTDNKNTSDANEQASTSSGAGAAAPSSTAPAPTAEQGSIMARLFDRMALERQQRKEAKQKYAFWETQPVVQFTEGSSNNVGGAAVTTYRSDLTGCFTWSQQRHTHPVM